MEQSKSPKLVKQLLIVNADMIHGIFTQLCSPIQNPSCHELNVGNQLSWKKQYIIWQCHLFLFISKYFQWLSLSFLSILKYCPHWSQRLKIANSQILKSNIFCGTVVFMPSVICQNKHSSSSNQQIES